MSRRSATSSDLELARALSLRLSGGRAEGQPGAPAAQGYVHFAPSPPAPATMPGQPEGLTIELKRFETWDRLLDWCLSLTRATTAFVMDPEGFAIAHRGALSDEEIQGVGSQLMVAMSQADRLEHPGTPALSVCVEFEVFWVTGLRLAAEGRGAFTMGFIASGPVDLETRDAIRLQATHNLEHL
jgi:hypothetical protein